MALERQQHRTPIFLHFRPPTNPIRDLILELSANYAFLRCEDEGGAIYLERCLLDYRSVIQDEPFSIITKCVKIGIRLSNILVEIALEYIQMVTHLSNRD